MDTLFTCHMIHYVTGHGEWNYQFMPKSVLKTLSNKINKKNVSIWGLKCKIWQQRLRKLLIKTGRSHKQYLRSSPPVALLGPNLFWERRGRKEGKRGREEGGSVTKKYKANCRYYSSHILRFWKWHKTLIPIHTKIHEVLVMFACTRTTVPYLCTPAIELNLYFHCSIIWLLLYIEIAHSLFILLVLWREWCSAGWNRFP